MQQLSLDDFALFTRVAALGSLSAVARERDVPVSQISRTLSRMEQHTGVRLLHRSTHGLSLTPEGDTLREHALQLLATGNALADDLARSSAEIGGTVRVALSAAMADYLIAPSLQGLAQRHPRLALDLRVSDAAVDMVHDGIDLAIRTGPVADTLVARQLCTHGRRLYCAPAYVRRKGRPRTPADLAQHSLITSSASSGFNVWPFTIKGQASRYEPQGQYRCESSSVMIRLALEGLGITRANDLIVAPLVRQGLLVPVLEKYVHHEPIPINAVMLPERQRAARVRACVDYWLGWFGTMAAR
jgi:DNA-binding transcriptional LysR family regulator